MNGPLVMQFAKLPVLGRVKTRLAKDLGEKEALEVHKSLTEQVCNNLSGSKDYGFELWVAGAEDTITAGNAFEFLTRSLILRRQEGQDLGDRMGHGLQDGLARHSACFIVGSDCPTVDDDYMQEAIAAVQSHDLVFIPSEDGGYVLVGASRFIPGLFDYVDWGTSKVLAQTTENAARLNLSYVCLEPTWDVDEIEDYQRWLSCSVKKGEANL